MPPRRKQKRSAVDVDEDGKEINNEELNEVGEVLEEKVMCQLVDENGEDTGPQLVIPLGASAKQLDVLLTQLLEDEEEKEIPYAFFLGPEQISSTVASVVHKQQRDTWVDKQTREGRRFRPSDIEDVALTVPEEQVLKIVYKPQAVFRVRPVSRCSAALDGHAEAVLVVHFSPNGGFLATGGGDNVIRLWDTNTSTPIDTLPGHSSWVQVLSFSPNCRFLASGSKDGTLILWTENEEKMKWMPYKTKAHSQYLSHIAWEPLHKNAECTRFVTASKDANIKVWAIKGRQMSAEYVLGGHDSCVTSVKWGGEGYIYSSSQDRSIIVWDASTGGVHRKLMGHGHWVNMLALSTDHVLRTGAHDHEEKKFDDSAAAQAHAKKRYDAVIARTKGEKLFSCSDDNTLYFWSPLEETKPLARLTGHQGVVFGIAVSPDGTMLASCSADKSVRIWNGVTGKFIHTFRGHVGTVYHVSWSLDSRMLVSGSRDSTLKLWSVVKKELVEDLSGHADEIFSTDWSPDGTRVATGSKDKQVRIWVH